MSQHDLSSDEFKRVEAKSQSEGSKQNLACLGWAPSQKTPAIAKPKDASEHGISTQYSNMLDCPHKLAPYLPLDVRLVFDDTFNEIGRPTGRNENTGPGHAVEGADAHIVNNVME